MFSYRRKSVQQGKNHRITDNLYHGLLDRNFCELEEALAILIFVLSSPNRTELYLFRLKYFEA